MTTTSPGPRVFQISRASRFIIPLTLLFIILTSCVTAPIPVDPVYTGRIVRGIEGEISLGKVLMADAKPQDRRSLGAVQLPEPIRSFCREALIRELESYGLTIVSGAPLLLDVRVLKAETEWKRQGAGGVFSTLFSLAFSLSDSAGQVRYNSIHQGSSAHSQAYGGYPAAASVSEALASAYERFLRDPELTEVLKKSGSANLYQIGGEKKGGTDTVLENQLYRDYRDAVAALFPHLSAALGSGKFEERIAIVGFYGGEAAGVSLLSAKLSEELSSRLGADRFKVVTRELEKVFEEQKLQLSGLVEESTMVRAGRLTGASKLITGSIEHLASEGTLIWNCKIIDVESGLVDASFNLELVASESHLQMLEAE